MKGHLRYLTTESDIAKLGECAPSFRPVIAATMSAIEWQLKAKSRNGIVPRIFEAWRSKARQMEHYAKGRIKTPLGWVIDPMRRTPIVTNLLPEDAPHCVSTKDGTAAALAIDVWLLDDLTGELLADRHPAWALVPAAAYLACGLTVASGAFWNVPRDWSHLEVRDWERQALVQQSGMVRLLREVAV